MNYGAAASIVSAFVAIGASGMGILWWLFNTWRIANEAKQDIVEIRNEREKDKEGYDKRLEKAEDAAASIRDLASAINHLGELTKLSMDNLSRRVEEHASFTRKAFDDVQRTQNDQGGEIKTIQKIVAKLN